MPKGIGYGRRRGIRGGGGRMRDTEFIDRNNNGRDDRREPGGAWHNEDKQRRLQRHDRLRERQSKKRQQLREKAGVEEGMSYKDYLAKRGFKSSMANSIGYQNLVGGQDLNEKQQAYLKMRNQRRGMGGPDRPRHGVARRMSRLFDRKQRGGTPPKGKGQKAPTAPRVQTRRSPGSVPARRRRNVNRKNRG